jgi:hypothetical protein
MAFLSQILKPHFTALGVQGVQGTSSSTQGVQGVQGVQGTIGVTNGTLITNTQSGSYTLQASDVGEVISGVSTVGIPSDVFNPGQNVVILNNDLSRTILNIEGKNPAVSIYEAGVGIALTDNRQIKNKSFISIFCTRLNEFILSGSFLPTIEATGGTIVDSDGYRIHVFTGTGPFNVSFIGPPSYNNVEYVVVAGGGGVALAAEGGGGAGGFRTGTGFPVTVQDYTITVGGGGPNAGVANGNDSVFSTITSSGGGFGGAGNGNPGGSGGGAGIPGTAGNGNTPPTSPPQGNPGATSVFSSFPTVSNRGGGGGGAGGAGSSQNGGVGSPVTWVPASYGTPGPAPGRYFAGGGGALTPGSGVPTGTGGAGGGGDEGSPGTVNTGGGGGGNNTSGGSGIVIIRYPIT